MNTLRFPLAVAVSLLVAVAYDVAAGDEPDPKPPATTSHARVSFSQDILRLLSDRCFLCHGPDEGTREAELRLDRREDATRSRDGSFVVKPGDPARSQIIARLVSTDEDVVMPPPDSGHEPLTAKEVDLIRRWIAEGADWSAHWAFVPPVRPKVPTVKYAARVRNPIDAFVMGRLEKEGLSPSPMADRLTLLRRLSLDLIGLPPSVEEIDQWEAANASADDRGVDEKAYGKLVNRLLKSPHYGERWGRVWLDAARYADSDGFEKDKPRQVWFYRDWVINSLNRDLPYDQFIIEQIAGDLLPDATQDQIVATGFLRNSMLNEEGGIDPEEFRMQAMFDRMDTVGKAVLGFTVQCGQCHSHKYDPFTHRDYYRMFAFLNNSHEAQPTVYTRDQQTKRDQIFASIRKLEERLRADHPDWPQQVAAWEKSVRETATDWTVLPIENAGSNSQRYYQQADKSLLAQGYAPTRFEAPFSVQTDMPEIRSFRLEMLNHPDLPAGGPGRAVDGQFALTEFKVKAVSVVDPSKSQTVKFVRATADFSNERTQLGAPYTDQKGKSSGVTGPVEYAIDGDNSTAWGVDAGPDRRNQPRNAVFVADKNVAFTGGTKLTITLAQRQGGWNSDDNQTLNLGRFRISATGVEATANPVPADVQATLDMPLRQRSKEQTRQVFSYWRTTVAEWKQTNDEIESLWRQHPEGTTQFVLHERVDPRATHMLKRGDFLKPEAPVTAGVPGFMHSLTANQKHSRLEFARWLVDRRSPTAARSIVNRVWQSYFGTGLVDTPEDLGSTGSQPSHPDLLDWLAVELMDNGWSLKHIHRLIVTSNTYRQTADVGGPAAEKDPINRLLSRGARFRVDAEIVRDIFLAASGLLNRKVGGRSVYPPAPEFLFQRPASYGPKVWAYETGPDKYRRALYTFRFRSVPYPALQAFDAPSGEFSTVRRARSNTPLQALTTLNEPLFVESAQALARQAVTEGGDTDAARLKYIFRRCVTRPPTPDESKLLLNVLRKQTARFESGSLNTAEVLGVKDETEQPRKVTSAQLAGWTVVSRIVLNLDETITRE